MRTSFITRPSFSARSARPKQGKEQQKKRRAWGLATSARCFIFSSAEPEVGPVSFGSLGNSPGHRIADRNQFLRRSSPRRAGPNQNHIPRRNVGGIVVDRLFNCVAPANLVEVQTKRNTVVESSPLAWLLVACASRTRTLHCTCGHSSETFHSQVQKVHSPNNLKRRVMS